MIDGKWAANHTVDCSDPKELLESIVFKPEDVINSIQFYYWTKSSTTYYNSIHEFKDWYHTDYIQYGRCITLEPSYEHSQYGILRIVLALLVNSTIFIHSTPGLLMKGSDQLMSTHYVELGKFYTMPVSHEVRELLDYGGDPCNKEKTYHVDICNAKGFEEKSLATVGCTSPYATNKSKICTDAYNGKTASNIYLKNMISGTKNNEGCYYPCVYLKVSSTVSSKDLHIPERAFVDFDFEELIQETKSYYTYSGLSLIAEIGGYVGLFLGISVNQMPNLLEILDAILARIRSLFKF